MSASQRPRLLTVAEFVDYPGERQELVDGVVLDMAPASPRHGAIQAQAARLLGNHLDAHPRCFVVIEPGVQPRANASHNVRVPDLAVTCEPIAIDTRLLAEPVLLIEILSSSNTKDTRGNVWSYTTIPSVREIVVMHTEEVLIELLRREDDGNWPSDPALLASNDPLTLASIGFEMPVNAFYRALR